MNSPRYPLSTLLLCALLLLIPNAPAQAGSATWKTVPLNSAWNTANNWTPRTVPNGLADTATFSVSNRTGVFLSANTEVNGIVFNAGASPYTITANPTFTLTISGIGITNNSALAQNFVTGGGSVVGSTIEFTSNAIAGGSPVFTNNGGVGGILGGSTLFFDNASADHGTFINNGGAVTGGKPGFTQFHDNSTAANGIFINNVSAISGVQGGQIDFSESSTAGTGAFLLNGGMVAGGRAGTIAFFDTSTAAQAAFTADGATVSGANGGQISFFGSSTADGGTFRILDRSGTGDFGGIMTFDEDSNGGTARLEIFGTGELDISDHNTPGVTTGSIEGSGLVFLGAINLTVGGNNLSTVFSGVIQDGGAFGGTNGSLTKIGTGTLMFTGANIYTGGTTITNGLLLVKNRTGSATGTGAVQVNAGTLGGTGKIAGAATIGTGAFLSPGNTATKPARLTIQSTLTLNSGATYQFGLNSSTAKADSIVAKGVTISAGIFSFIDLGTGTLTLGAVFTVINNTATTPIAGTFANLPDGSTFTNHDNTFQADYEGGDGNDLTLTVVP